MDLQKFWILLMMVAAANSFASYITGFDRSSHSTFLEKVIHNGSIEIRDIHYNTDIPFRTTGFLTGTLSYLHFNHDFAKKFQMKCPTVFTENKKRDLHSALQKLGNQSCKFILSHAFFCRFQI